MTNITDYYFLIEQSALQNYEENIVAFNSNLEFIIKLRDDLNNKTDTFTTSYVIRQGKNPS